ncbi:MAG: hypothetical protein PHV12_04525 [Bacteroidales bacterium]|nr:hypothetical protein [Bacteroidales bacterium]
MKNLAFITIFIQTKKILNMKITAKIFAAITLAALFVIPVSMNAQKMPKKYKNSPDETIVIVTNSPREAFDESEYPNLKFYYTPEEMPDFLKRLHMVQPIPINEGITGMVVDKEGVIAYVRGFNNALAKNNDREDEMSWTILSVATRKGTIGAKGPLDDYLKDYIAKEKTAKKDDKKSYTEGSEPSFKGWDKGNIEGMELPDFKLIKKDGTEVTIKQILDGKPAFIVFAKIPPAAGSGVTPMFWHIENIMYNYYPPRRR